jgi:CelD/BcsL family acetyltransferase involved in cellulose biosynthesis
VDTVSWKTDNESDPVVEIRAVRPDALTEDDVRAWTAIQRSVPQFANPHFSPQFARLSASVWSGIEVAVFRTAHGRPVGFFPFERGILGLGRPAARILSDFQGVVIEPQVQWCVDDLLSGCRLSSLEFDHLLASQEQFADAISERSFSRALDLSEGFEKYAEDRRVAGSNITKQLGKFSRRLEREVGPSAFEADTRDDTVVDWIVAHQARRYEVKGYTNAMRLPAVGRIVDRIRDTHTVEFAGLVSVLRAGDRIVAAHMGMRSRTVWHSMFSAHDAEFERFSPGMLIFINMARSANDLGLTRIDLGKGDLAHKRRLANSTVAVAKARVELRSLKTVPARAISRARDALRRSPMSDSLRQVYRKYRDR